MTHYVGLLQMKEEIHNTYPNLWQHGWSWYHKDWQLWSTQTVMWQTSQTRDHRQSTDRHTYSSIVENLGIATVWIFATQLPDIKERLPVDVGSKSWDVVVLQHSATEERRCNSTHNHSSHCSGPATLIHTKCWWLTMLKRDKTVWLVLDNGDKPRCVACTYWQEAVFPSIQRACVHGLLQVICNVGSVYKRFMIENGGEI